MQYNDEKEEFKTIQPNLDLEDNHLMEAVLLAIDSGAANLDGMKECYLVNRYFERLYYRANPGSNPRNNSIYALDYELPSFPEPIADMKGDQFIRSKADGWEKHWPDVLMRKGKYSIVHHIDQLGEQVSITTQNATNLDDIRIPVTKDSLMMAEFVLCKKNNKWGAFFSGLQIFMNLVVPFEYNTPEEAAKEINKLLEHPIETRWVSWSDFKGYNSFSYLGNYD